MREVEVSPRARDLLDAAKGDAPSALAKAKIWGGIAATTAAAAGAGAGAAGGAAAAAGGSGKLVVIGALFGSAVTVGLAVALMHVGPAPAAPSSAPPARPAAAAAARPASGAPLSPSPGAPDGLLLDLPAGDPAAPAAGGVNPAATADHAAAPADLASSAHDATWPADPAGLRADDPARARAGDPTPTRAGDPARARIVDPARARIVDPAPPYAGDSARPYAGDSARAGAEAPSPTRAGDPSARTRGPAGVGARGGRDGDDALTRETILVAEARGALRRGDAQSALATVRAARATGSRALEPEELALEAKSLRALGRDAEAAAVESSLRARFPDHALAH